jgi:hypothetical protein
VRAELSKLLAKVANAPLGLSRVERLFWVDAVDKVGSATDFDPLAAGKQR